MNELDMSRPGSELFPESSSQQYNSYSDVMVDSVVGDPLDMGVTQQAEVATQEPVSDKELNFRALREEAAKLKSEREYWKGQADALNKAHQQPTQKQEPAEQLDWDDSTDVRRAWETMRHENEQLRNEMRDSLAAIRTKTERSDWDSLVTQNVPELTSKNPLFAEMIQKASNPYEAAYLLAELNSKGRPQERPVDTRPTNAQRAIANMQKPQTLASTGGSASLSSADYYASMSDEDFHKIAAKNLANI
jgi:hypothetical protein